MEIIGLREYPEQLDRAIGYIYSRWGNVNNSLSYRDCIEHSIGLDAPLPRWYLLEEDDEIIGCAGLLINDYVSRMDLYPWISSLYIEPKRRGSNLGSIILTHIKEDAKKAGFDKVYLCTDFNGYYEKYGYTYIGTGYHPWGESSRIYVSGD